ncbi:MAG: hypothetical protein IPK02_00335 [Candidatus Accumulibacter sp.]|uniref:Uncharacterized protein n=1 Tax=Candidatus Accumulibacter affinis TaxID=2954384 RepID=A0A935TDZ1_9PROT|nr:hypothetical protein [Candidatus Accumulibacter affinis]
MAHQKAHNCLFCGEVFQADARNAAHQKYCSEAPCRKASQTASRRTWLAKSENQDYFRGPENVARVQAWRAAHPGYWRRPRREIEVEAQVVLALQDVCPLKHLKSLRNLKNRRKVRYKMSGAINPLF